MAKISEKAQQASGIPQQGTNVVPIGEGRMVGPPPGMTPEEMEEMTGGRGLSTKASDNIIPMVYISHYTSQWVDERDPSYVRGARPGDLLLRGAPGGEELAPATEGMLFQPCVFWNDVTEWIPRGAGGGGGKGFVCKHGDATNPIDFAKYVPGAKQGPNGKFHWVTADGLHDLEETRNFVGFAYLKSGLRLPFLIAMKGTNHQIGKAWMTRMLGIVASNGKPIDSYVALYRIRTEPRNNEKGRWFTFTVADARWATAEEKVAGRGLYEQFMAGKKEVEQPADEVYDAGEVRERVDASI